MISMLPRLSASSGVPRLFALGVGLTSASALGMGLQYRLRSRPLLCETLTGSSVGEQAAGAFRTYQQDARVPLMTRDGKVNRKVFGQISSGSILGLVSGIAVSMFSKTLTVLIGITITGVQYLESKGLHIIPTDRIQGYFRGINVRSAVQDNVAFKICFGATFALAAFAEF